MTQAWCFPAVDDRERNCVKHGHTSGAAGGYGVRPGPHLPGPADLPKAPLDTGRHSEPQTVSQKTKEEEDANCKLGIPVHVAWGGFRTVEVTSPKGIHNSLCVAFSITAAVRKLPIFWPVFTLKVVMRFSFGQCDIG